MGNETEIVEIVYYRLLEMEQRLTQKAQAMAALLEKADEIIKRLEIATKG